MWIVGCHYLLWLRSLIFLSDLGRSNDCCIPPKPITTWNIAETAMAPESSLIRNCHNSVRFSMDISLMISVDGHFHWGKFNIAKVGTKNEMVPPCTKGNLKELIKTIFSQQLWNLIDWLTYNQMWFVQKSPNQ